MSLLFDVHCELRTAHNMIHSSLCQLLADFQNRSLLDSARNLLHLVNTIHDSNFQCGKFIYTVQYYANLLHASV